MGFPRYNHGIMPSLSIIMIVKNEAHCLAQCLESVRAIADEIVVADTGSRDGTQDVARRFSAKLFDIPWREDFAWARNQSIAAASGDWLLHLDADEVLDPLGAKAIAGLVGEDGRGCDAVEVWLANYCNDPRAWRWSAVDPGAPHARGHAGCIKVPLLRLFRNHRGFEYREAVHESITESVLEKGGRIRREDIVIHHYGYDPDALRRGEKAKQYLAIAREKAAAKPGSLKALHDFAEQALACNLTDEAEAACRKALAVDPLHLESATTLANILLNRGDLAEAKARLDDLEGAGISPPHVVTALAAIALRQGHLEEAESRLDAVLATEPRHIMALLYKARALDRLGHPDEARQTLERLHATAPALKEFSRLLEARRLRSQAETAFAAGHPARALEELIAAAQDDPEDPYIHNSLGVVLHSLGETTRAKASLERALQLAPALEEARENLKALS